jgi:chorismate-pyruvate lyase
MAGNGVTAGSGSATAAGSSAAAAPAALTRRHFVCQEDRPAHLGDLGLTEMEPSLRGLLFTDGTVTRALEAEALARVSVEVVAQSSVPLPASAAAHLDAGEGCEAVRRRVAIGTAAHPQPLIWAESHILPERLPSDFLSVLHDAPDGIGESLQQVKLESWRDMLWFGLDTPPQWSGIAAEPPRQVLTRRYRVIAGSRPVLLICESFAVERQAGHHRLGWHG